MGCFGPGNGMLSIQNLQPSSIDSVQMEADIVELMAQNLSRLDEGSEIDKAGVYYVLSRSTE